MIIIGDIDKVDFNNSRVVEVHQSFSSLQSISENIVDLSSNSCDVKNSFFEVNYTATTLNSSINNTVEQLVFRKEILLKKRNEIFNSFFFRFFNFHKERISVIDSALDKLEEEICFLKKPEIQKEILQSGDLVKEINKNIAKYKSEIDENV